MKQLSLCSQTICRIKPKKKDLAVCYLSSVKTNGNDHYYESVDGNTLTQKWYFSVTAFYIVTMPKLVHQMKNKK